MTVERVKRARPDVIIMHPGPMNRGVEIASDVADGPYSVILEQVANGVAVRMARCCICSPADLNRWTSRMSWLNRYRWLGRSPVNPRRTKNTKTGRLKRISG